MCFKRRRSAPAPEADTKPAPSIEEQQATQQKEAEAAKEAEEAKLRLARQRELERERQRLRTEEQIRKDQESAASRQAERDRGVGGVGSSGMRSDAARRRRSLRAGRGRRSLLTSTVAGMGYFSRFL
jgi:hypothetical protein